MNEKQKLDAYILQKNQNRVTPECVEKLHKYREDFLQAIQLGDMGRVMQFEKGISSKWELNQLDILNRVPNNEIRSYKNILLSHNTLYSYAAEKGGLSPWQCHFMSEKYAIMIEHAQSITELDKIHLNMVAEYTDPSIRKPKRDNLTIVEKAENYIEMNFAEDISIEEMAGKIHVHPSHLMRTFKKEKGTTISHYRNLRRIKEAKELVLYSNLSMTEISMMVGFSNPQFFSKFFKEVEGATPVEFKKKAKVKY